MGGDAADPNGETGGCLKELSEKGLEEFGRFLKSHEIFEGNPWEAKVAVKSLWRFFRSVSEFWRLGLTTGVLSLQAANPQCFVFWLAGKLLRCWWHSGTIAIGGFWIWKRGRDRMWIYCIYFCLLLVLTPSNLESGMNDYSLLCYPSVLLHWLFSIDLLTPGQETSQDTSALGMSLRLHNEKSGQAGKVKPTWGPLQDFHCRRIAGYCSWFPKSQKYLRQLPHRPILPYFASPKLSSEVWWKLIIREFWGMHTQKILINPGGVKKPGASSRLRVRVLRRQRSKCIPWRACVRTQRPFWFVQTFHQT